MLSKKNGENRDRWEKIKTARGKKEKNVRLDQGPGGQHNLMLFLSREGRMQLDYS